MNPQSLSLAARALIYDENDGNAETTDGIAETYSSDTEYNEARGKSLRLLVVPYVTAYGAGDDGDADLYDDGTMMTRYAEARGNDSLPRYSDASMTTYDISEETSNGDCCDDSY